MQGIHIVNCNLEHDFALVRRNRTNGFAQVSNLHPLSNSFFRFHEAHEFWELSPFKCSNNEYVCHHFSAKQTNELSVLDSKREVKSTLIVEPGGVEPPSKQATPAAFSMLSPRLVFDQGLTVDGPPLT